MEDGKGKVGKALLERKRGRARWKRKLMKVEVRKKESEDKFWEEKSAGWGGKESVFLNLTYDEDPSNVFTISHLLFPPVTLCFPS